MTFMLTATPLQSLGTDLYYALSKTQLIEACDAVIQLHQTKIAELTETTKTYPFRTEDGSYTGPYGHRDEYTHIHLLPLERKRIGVDEDKISLKALAVIRDTKITSVKEFFVHQRKNFRHPYYRLNAAILYSRQNRYDFSEWEIIVKQSEDLLEISKRKEECKEVLTLKEILIAHPQEQVISYEAAIRNLESLFRRYIEGSEFPVGSDFKFYFRIFGPERQYAIQADLYSIAVNKDTYEDLFDPFYARPNQDVLMLFGEAEITSRLDQISGINDELRRLGFNIPKTKPNEPGP